MAKGVSGRFDAVTLTRRGRRDLDIGMMGWQHVHACHALVDRLHRPHLESDYFVAERAGS